MNTSLKIFRGDDITINVRVKDSAGDAVDITGYTFWFTAKSQESDIDANAEIQKEVTSHTTPASGLTAITLSNSDTDLDTDKEYFYDIQMKDTGGSVTTLVKGRMLIKKDITVTS